MCTISHVFFRLLCADAGCPVFSSQNRSLVLDYVCGVSIDPCSTDRSLDSILYIQTPPPAGVASFDTAALTSNFANMAGTNVAIEGVSSSYSRSAYSQNGGGGTVNVPGLKNTGGSKDESGWAGLSDGVHYAIYAGAAALAIMLLVSFLIFIFFRFSFLVFQISIFYLC